MCCLRDKFSLKIDRLEHYCATLHNVHYLARDALRTYHVKVRSFSETGDTPEDIEAILLLETRLTGRTSAVSRTNIASRQGRYLVGEQYGYVSVRQHLGNSIVAHPERIARILDDVVEHGRAIDQLVAPDLERSQKLRYLPPASALPQIAARLDGFVASHATRGQVRELHSAVKALTRTALSSPEAPVRLVHGDLAQSNLIEYEGAINVIDHDCMHHDHHLYDEAHLFAEICSTAYFCGEFRHDRAVEFLRARRGEGQPDSARAFLEVVLYVMLKKLALVRKPENLKIPERIELLREVKSLAG
jgi:hypothetical protein